MIGYVFLDTYSKSPGLFYRGRKVWTSDVEPDTAYKWYISPINVRRSFNNIKVAIL